ncbi:MAG: hypothetical protein PHG05_02960 [Candidatus Nanoarchaeia archaeon]|nr:hypothetical protein [Candidatus Nanoarchaeia archaeon]
MKKIILFCLSLIFLMSFSVYAPTTGVEGSSLKTTEDFGTGYCDCAQDSCEVCTSVTEDSCVTGNAYCWMEGPIIARVGCADSGSCAGCRCVCTKDSYSCSKNKDCCSGNCVNNKCGAAACGGVGQACCTNDACSLDTVYCSKQYYDVNGVLKTVSPHCCYKGQYWDPNKNSCWDNEDCNTVKLCPVVFGTPWEKFFQNPMCIYKSTSWLACCSAGSIYGTDASDYKAVIIY